MVARKSAASGNAAAKRPSRRRALSAAEAVQEPQEGAGVGWGLSGAQEPVTEPADETATEESTPKTKRSGRKANAGHSVANDASDDGAVNLTNMTSDLVAGVEAVERIAEEISVLKNDAKDTFDSLKSKGYSPKYLRMVLRRRSMDPDKRKEQDDMIALYEEALRGA